MPQPIAVGSVLGGRYRVTSHVVTSADQDMVFEGTDQVLNRQVHILVASLENATQVASSARELATGERQEDVQVLDLGLSEGRTYLIAGGAPDPDVLLGLAYPQQLHVEPFQTDTLGSEIFGESRTGEAHEYDDDEAYYTDLDRRLRADERQSSRRPGFLSRLSDRLNERVRPADGTAAKAAAGASALAAADAATRAQLAERERAEREAREAKEREAEETAREAREAEERARQEAEAAEERAEQERQDAVRREAEEAEIARRRAAAESTATVATPVVPAPSAEVPAEGGPAEPAAPAPRAGRLRPVPRRALDGEAGAAEAAATETTTDHDATGTAAGAGAAAGAAGAASAAGAAAAAAGTATAATPGAPAGDAADTAPAAALTTPTDEAAEPVREETSQDEPRRPFPWGLAALLALLLVGATVAGFLLLGQNLGRTPTGPAPTSTAPAAPASPTTAASPTPAPADTDAPAGVAPAPVAVTRVVPDMPALEADNDATLGNLIDGNPATAWQSYTYQRPNFGGYVGSMNVVMQLQQRAAVQEVVVQHQGATGGAWTAYVADSATGANARQIGAGSFDEDRISIPAGGAEGQYVIFTITSLPQLENSQALPYGVRLTEISVR
ncbi:hypothetical protein [Micrococcus sp.]|uniref:hypothetical protein n=1 Tax=Micrococcus sp. TaxID=1271 RepID=UPI002A91BC18|nr:hypothetical protein [Micrococcus sp.]MDY6054555.1 hypothetical protein [Micrococcus sp.]